MRFVRTLMAIAGDWLVIVGTIAVSERWFSIPGCALAIIVIASRQQAIGILAHEAIHWPAGDTRKGAVAICKIFCAWPILMHFESFRQIHLAHHHHLLTENDPDYVRNRPEHLYAATSLLQILKYLTGLNRQRSPSAGKQTSGILKMSNGIVILWFLAGTSVWIFGVTQIFLIYWVCPLFTVFVVLVRLRGVLEHTGIPTDSGLVTRTTLGNTLSNFIFLPHAIGRHGEHHQDPQIAWYDLGRVKPFKEKWHTCPGVARATIEVLAATRWYNGKFVARRHALPAKK